MNWIFCIFTAVFIVVCLHVQCVTTGSVKLEPLPQAPNYKASGTEYDDGGMGPMFDFARSFINTALPGGFPADFINETISGSGSQDIAQLAQKLLKTFTGYVAAIAVGILFIVTVPLVGVCFCCCRLCGNCGGNRVQKESDDIHCKRRVFAGILFVTTVFTLVGNICTYVSNDRMTTALEKVGGIVENNLDDLDTFLNVTVEQAKVIGIENLGITKNAIVTKLDKDAMAKEIGGFAVNQLSDGALDKMDARRYEKLTRSYEMADRQQTEIQSVVKAFDAVSSKTDAASAAYSNMKSSCAAERTCSMFNGKLSSDPLTGNGLTVQQKNDFSTFRNNDAVKKVKTEIGNNIATLIQATDFTGMKGNVTVSFDTMKVKVKKFVDEIENFKTEAHNGIDLQSYRNKAKSYTETAQNYDKYRHIGGSVLAAVVTLIVSLQFFGLVFGSVGQGLRAAPSERGCVSNAGGNFLIASVAFIFFFSWLLMLLTTLTFAVGSILERFVCQPLSPPDFELLKVADKQFDSRQIFGASIAQVLKDCRNGKAAYEAFHLSSKGLNLKDMEDKLQDELQNIDKEMDKAVSEMNGKTIGTGNAVSSAQSSLTSLTNLLSVINYNAVDTVMNDLSRLPKNSGSVAQYTVAMENLHAALKDLKQAKDELKPNAFIDSLTKVSTDIGSKTQEITDGFKKEIMKIVNDYVENTKDSIRNKIGKCTPLWNMYDSIIVVSVCKYIVDAFNGFWFSIGWCLFFFVPSIVFSVKLAKHYRTMKTDEEVEGQQGQTNLAYDASTSGRLSRNNKVGHADIPDSQY